MPQYRVAYIARAQPDLTLVEQELSGLDYQMDVHLCASDGETIEAIKGADVIINQMVPMPQRVIKEIDKAQAIVSFGHGFNHIDHHAATNQGVLVVNCAGFSSEDVSNHAIMLLLACAKKLCRLNNVLKAGQWDATTRTNTNLLPMPAIAGQTLGILGLGNIGRASARKARAFGMTVFAYDPYIQPWIAKEYSVDLIPTPEELASRSDFISVHTPWTSETEKLVGESFFKAMKPTAFLINTSRGAVVDEKALIKALQEGRIAGAGLDVFEREPILADNPLLTMDNVIVTPHSAGTSDVSKVEGQVRIGQETARILKGTWPLALANPEVRTTMSRRQPATNR